MLQPLSTISLPHSLASLAATSLFVAACIGLAAVSKWLLTDRDVNQDQPNKEDKTNA